MLYYEDEEINVTGNSSDIKYDAEVMDSFTDALASDIDRYKERARALEREYVRYHNNETFVGQMAEDSKRFIYEVQGDKLHDKNIELKKEFLSLCLSIENKFKEEVDQSPKARVSVQTLSKIKKDFNVINSVADTAGYELDCCAKEAINIAGKWGVSTLPNFRRTVEALDEFCGHGKILDKDIRKLEKYDREACAIIDRKDLTGYADDLQRNIKYTAGVLDSMTVYQPNTTKNSVGLVSFSAMGAVKNNSFDSFKMLLSMSNSKKSDPVVITDPKYLETMQKEFGFTEEQAILLYEAYEKFEKKYPSPNGKEWNDLKIKLFFSNLAALNEGYACKRKFTGHITKDLKAYKDPFTALMVMPTNHAAIEFFNELGVDGKALMDAVNEQHSKCPKSGKRDFVHECAIFAIMSEHKGAKGLGEDASELFEKTGTRETLEKYGVMEKLKKFIKEKSGKDIDIEVDSADEDVDALIGYKGDIYSGSMGEDDRKSDIAAYNIYYRMRNSKNGDIWEKMMLYNEGVSEGSINGSREFLAHFGDGDPELGMEVLKEYIDNDTYGSNILKGDPEDIQQVKEEFLKHVSKESGVNWK